MRLSRIGFGHITPEEVDDEKDMVWFFNNPYISTRIRKITKNEKKRCKSVKFCLVADVPGNGLSKFYFENDFLTNLLHSEYNSIFSLALYKLCVTKETNISSHDILEAALQMIDESEKKAGLK